MVVKGQRSVKGLDLTGRVIQDMDKYMAMIEDDEARRQENVRVGGAWYKGRARLGLPSIWNDGEGGG